MVSLLSTIGHRFDRNICCLGCGHVKQVKNLIKRTVKYRAPGGFKQNQIRELS